MSLALAVVLWEFGGRGAGPNAFPGGGMLGSCVTQPSQPFFTHPCNGCCGLPCREVIVVSTVTLEGAAEATCPGSWGSCVTVRLCPFSLCLCVTLPGCPLQL